MSQFDRRQFLKSSLLGTSGALLSIPALGQDRGSKPPAAGPDKKIIKRKLGKTGIELPIVSFGVMRADNPGLVTAAIEAGIVYFDTAHTYQRGNNEVMLGEVLKDRPRNSFVIATKVHPEEIDSRTGEPKGEPATKAFLEKVDLSLQRLKLAYVDILYAHDISTKNAALYPSVLEALQMAKKSGKAKHIGLSTHKNQAEVIDAVVESGVLEVVLVALNFKQDDYEAITKSIAKAAKAGVGIVAMKTMAGGFYDKDRKQAINCKAALKYVLQDENITTAIPGSTNFDQLAMNVSVNQDVRLTDEERTELTMGKSQGSLYCQGCEHCVPGCPKNLPIPEIMRAYMYTYGYRQPEMAHSLLTSLNIPRNPCGSCSECTAICAKGFDISERITDVVRLTDVPIEFLS